MIQSFFEFESIHIERFEIVRGTVLQRAIPNYTKITRESERDEKHNNKCKQKENATNEVRRRRGERTMNAASGRENATSSKRYCCESRSRQDYRDPASEEKG